MAVKKGVSILKVSTTKDEHVKEIGAVPFAAGTFTTAGGDATESIAVTGAKSTDIAIVNVHTLGTGSRTIVSVTPTTNAITVVMSGDPSTNHVLSYALFRTV